MKPVFGVVLYLYLEAHLFLEEFGYSWKPPEPVYLERGGEGRFDGWAVEKPGMENGDRRRSGLSQDVHRTPDASPAAVEDVGVNHRSTDIPVPQ